MQYQQLVRRFSLAFICSLFLISLAIPSVLAQSGDNYKIVVKTTFEGNPIEGVDLKLTGNSVTRTETSGLSDTEFTGLSAGSYTVTITFNEDSDFELSANSSGSQTTELTPSNQSATLVFFLRKKEPPVDENLQKINAIKLPANLTKVGSTTTDFSKLTAAQLPAVDNFTFDNPGVNKITYLSKLDLSNYEDFSKISLISDYLDLESVGKVRFDIDLLKVFDKPARISMGKLRLVQLSEDKAPAKVLRNGANFELKNASYTNNQLSFDVDGFSTYTVAPRLEIDFSNLLKSDTADDEYQSETDTFKLNLLVDNLDATVGVFNNGEIVNVPAEPDSNGKIAGDVKLANGNNRIKVEVKLSNGEKIEEFFTVKYQGATTASNDISRLFGVAFFCLILLAGIGLGVYYLKIKKQQPGARSPLTRQKPHYNSNLLTDEEKRIYGDDKAEKEPVVAAKPLNSVDNKPTDEAMKAANVSESKRNDIESDPIVIDESSKN
jgi:hypothetical protein